MGGIIGRLFREFAIVVTLTIAVSAFVSLTLSPMMCSLFLRDEKHVRHGRLYTIIEGYFEKLLQGYTRGLDWVLAHQGTTLIVFLITLCSTVALYIVVPKGFFPQQDTGLITGLSDAAQDISFSQMVKVQHRLTDIIGKDPDVASYAASVGGSRPINNGFLIMSLKPKDERSSSADEVIRRLRQKFNSVTGGTAYLQAIQDINIGGRTTRTQYQYTLQDSDLDELNTWAPQLLQAMQKLPELRDVASDQQTNSTKVSLVIDRDQAARFGIQPELIDATLYDAYGQRQVTQYFTQLNAYHVILEVPPALQGDPGSLDKLYIKAPTNNQMVPLSSVAHYDTSHVTSLSINHQGQFPSVTLSFNLAPGAALGQAVDAINRTATDIRLPPGVVGSFQGSAQAFQDSLRSEPLLVLAALVVVYIILGMLYESYIHPLTILSTLPSAGVGALLMLIIFHFDLSVIALIGIILLIGIVKKNGIMMVDFALQAERERNLAPEQSIREACLMRFRPIMMTTMAALLGALPLMLGRGTGSEMRVPLGYTMVGGLVLSQALTLFTTPVIYLYLDRLRLRFSRHRAPPDGSLEPAT
jgi:multidrug efflux pump subunit AcrB